MTPEGASLDLAAEEERDLFEMANLYPRTTGLPVIVWISPKGCARHDVRIKVARTPGDRMDFEDAEIARPVLAWTAMNAGALLACWEGALDTMELGARLARYVG